MIAPTSPAPRPYERMLSWLASTGRVRFVPGVTAVHVQHDRWCPSQRSGGGLCSCEPNVVVGERRWTWADARTAGMP